MDVTESEIFVRHCFSRVARLSTFYGNCVVARVDKHILERAVRRVADVETVGRRAPGCHDVDVLEVGVRTVADTHRPALLSVRMHCDALNIDAAARPVDAQQNLFRIGRNQAATVDFCAVTANNADDTVEHGSRGDVYLLVFFDLQEAVGVFII